MIPAISNDSTVRQFDEALSMCREIFVNKLKDYGASWRIMRPRSITDQLYIKAKRIRTLEEGVACLLYTSDAADEL